MKRISTSAIAAVALLAAASMLRPHATLTERHVRNAGMPSLQELHTTAGASSLAVDAFDDRSLVFSR
ncbi:hypothetical protein [Bradyrhizobium niftali]|jgi:hypothetical protein|uniref:Uncharacterized protein n=1 Tax=Bradyrhizobium niftali TaxID=2560055 RepID=A0A4Y9KYL9_9BRAD|nr:hypothetical protein [Bradyrhizobium niftali]TFV36420.1 hypothetical protein E4K65_45605 [Bradyrhizobium niftali]